MSLVNSLTGATAKTLAHPPIGVGVPPAVDIESPVGLRLTWEFYQQSCIGPMGYLARRQRSHRACTTSVSGVQDQENRPSSNRRNKPRIQTIKTEGSGLPITSSQKPPGIGFGLCLATLNSAIPYGPVTLTESQDHGRR
jgi:hypothetical protein